VTGRSRRRKMAAETACAFGNGVGPMVHDNTRECARRARAGDCVRVFVHVCVRVCVRFRRKLREGMGRRCMVHEDAGRERAGVRRARVRLQRKVREWRKRARRMCVRVCLWRKLREREQRERGVALIQTRRTVAVEIDDARLVKISNFRALQ